MKNATREFLSLFTERLHGNNISTEEDLVDALSTIVKCADIYYSLEEEEGIRAKIPLNHTQEDWVKFLNSLNFSYDDGYGTQELYGTIWLKDGTWFTRWEYDGSEGWEHHVVPDIPTDLIPTVSPGHQKWLDSQTFWEDNV